MALKQCDYCRMFTDSKNTRCPSCSAPLNNKIIAEEGNIKETVSLKVTETINKVIPSANGTVPASPYSDNYNNVPKNNYADTDVQRTPDGRRLLNKWIVLVLALVGGCFGVHRFYEGKFVTGVFYVLTFGLFGIGVFIDIICILGKPTTYPSKNY